MYENLGKTRCNEADRVKQIGAIITDEFGLDSFTSKETAN
jgi:hypothetical protein